MKPQHFNKITVAALQCAVQDSDCEEQFGAPSNCIELGYDLKKLGSIALAQAIISQDNVRRRELKDFLSLMDLKWSTKLAKICMLNRRYNNKKPHPLPSDIEKLSKYLKVSLNEFDTHDTSLENHHLGVTLAEARLVTYNKRRSGKMQAVTIKDFNKRI